MLALGERAETTQVMPCISTDKLKQKYGVVKLWSCICSDGVGKTLVEQPNKRLSTLKWETERLVMKVATQTMTSRR